jgi:hypothetical protein
MRPPVDWDLLASGTAAADIFSAHTKELKGNNDLLTVTPDAAAAARRTAALSQHVPGVTYFSAQLTKPAIINEIHRRYFEAGADICETNTVCAPCAYCMYV